uniref:Galactosidase beta 1 like n=1 Tax=Junco hyemalis TaxID=40217 RepID=A0A8C5J9J2_JUNHY
MPAVPRLLPQRPQAVLVPSTSIALAEFSSVQGQAAEQFLCLPLCCACFSRVACLPGCCGSQTSSCALPTLPTWQLWTPGSMFCCPRSSHACTTREGTSSVCRWKMNMGATTPVTMDTCGTCWAPSGRCWAARCCSSPRTAREPRSCAAAPCRGSTPPSTSGQVSWGGGVERMGVPPLSCSNPPLCTSPGSNVTEAFGAQRRVEPRGPLVNSEYYTGWLDYWGEAHASTSAAWVARGLEDMLQLGASINMYMFHGGTNFAYWSGADYKGQYKPVTTSYDYDAPLSEAGDPTEKLFAIRTVISKFQPLPVGPMPPATPKYAYGWVGLRKYADLLDVLDVLCPSGPIQSQFPLTFEALKQVHGFVVYHTQLPWDVPDPATLGAPPHSICDRGYVMLQKEYQGTLEWDGQTTLHVTGRAGDSLDILMENMGRISFGANTSDFKGLLGNLSLNSRPLSNWLIYPLAIDTAVQQGWPHTALPKSSSGGRVGPAFYTGSFETPGIAWDTFVKFPGWSKGLLWINGFNLGRFWSCRGPQQTLFVPGSVLHAGRPNNITVLELEGAPPTPLLLFLDRPLYNRTLGCSTMAME